MSKPTPEYTNDTRIFLLMSQRDKRARGFQDRRKRLTFAFTSEELAKAFLERGKPIGLLADVDMLFETTAGEFFAWVEQGKASGELAIDPPPSILENPLFAHERFIGN